MPNLLKAKGLITYRNETNVPDGAMDVADNIVIDEDDVIELRRGQADFGDTLPEGSDRVKQILEYKDRLFRHYNSTLQFGDGSGSFVDFNGSYQELEDGLRIKYLEANGNFYFTDNTGIKKISAKDTSHITADSIFDAGVPRAVSIDASLKFSVGGFLPPQSKCAYRVLWGKKDKNNNLLLGYPSERFVLTNTADSVEINESFSIKVNNIPDNEDIITLETSTTQYFLWYDTDGTEEAPETSQTLGRTPVKVSIVDPGETVVTVASKTANAIASIQEFNVSVVNDTITVELTEAGDVENPEYYRSGVVSSLNFDITNLEQGSVTEGDSANATVTFSVPEGIDNTYFYQIYRTSPVTVPEGLSLDDIDPGDEMNLALEGNPLDGSGNIVAEVTEEDVTPEDFRASAVFLYTNPISGEGILQANSRPPVAKDISLFNGSTFFANTKTTHKFTVNLVSVLNMTSGVSDFIISNEDVIRRYTAVGATQVQDITITTAAVANKSLLIDSVKDERNYFLWYDENGQGTQPSGAEFDNRLAIRVRYENNTIVDTTDDIATKTATALAATGDFQVSVLGSTLTINWDRNGTVNLDARDSSTAATGFTFDAPSTEGDGEDLATQEFTLSSFISVASSIDESARSLVKVINADSLSPVNAYYLSGADSVPGIILLEARTLEDKSFYIATSDSNIIDDFDPSLTLERAITNITAGVQTEIESVSHGLFEGQEIYINLEDSTPQIKGTFAISLVDADNFTIDFETTIGSTTPINSDFFVASNESDNEETPNRLYFSKPFQPESVPIVNFLDIGPKDKALLRILPLRDNLFALKEDGVYIISGTSAPNFTVRLLDSSISFLAPDSAVVLNNSIYALSDDGVVRISDTGVEVISRPIENLIKNVVNSRYSYEFISFGVTYNSDRSYLLWLPERETDTVATQCYRYNTFTRTWTRFTVTATCGLVANRDDKMYLGSGDTNSLTQERKNGDRTDYADRNFNLALLPSGVNSNILTVSSVVDLEEGDVVYQSQYVTLSILRRLLRKLDLDKLIPSSDYFSSITVEFGSKVSSVIQSTISKLISDGILVTNQTISDDPIIQQGQYNILITELNDPLSGTGLKDYKEANDLVPYEMIISKITTINNTVELNFEVPFVEGDITIFKGINAKWQYAPEHFGDPSSLKQIRQGTIIFDQNSFYGGIIAYASDQSADFIDTPFSGYGIGDWSYIWGEGTWGGLGNDIPYRTLIPLEKQRCRYLTVQIRHSNAREIIRVNGISLMVRQLSNRAYR